MYNPIKYQSVLRLNMDKESATEGIALIGFGSSRPYNKEAMLFCLDGLKRSGYKNTYYSFIGRESPSISEMMEAAKNDGIEHLTVIPYLMSTGEMSLKYIPQKLGINGFYGEQTSGMPGGIRVNYLRPIGESPKIAEIYDDLIKHTPAGKGKKALMLISHGSKMGYRYGLLDNVKTEMIHLGYRDIYTASVEFEDPPVNECAEQMVKDGIRHIIAVPLLLASGVHHKEDIPVALGLKEGMSKGTARIWNRDIRIDITPPVGKHPKMKEIISEIVENA